MPYSHEGSSAEGEVGPKTILVREDDEGIGELITLALAEASPSYFPLVVADAQEALYLEQHAEEVQQRQMIGLAKPFELDELLQTVAQLLMSGVQVGYQ